MHQQINLFQPVFRKQHKVFSAATLAQMTAAVAFLLILLLIHASWTLASMEATADSMQQQYSHMQQEISTLEEALRTPDTESLDNEIESLQTRIEARTELLARFDDLAIENQNGFYNQFHTLAEQYIPGLWLEGVNIDNKARIEVRGGTLNAQLVPVYLQQLAKQDDLSATPFETVKMTRPDPEQPKIGFVLRNFREDPTWD